MDKKQRLLTIVVFLLFVITILFISSTTGCGVKHAGTNGMTLEQRGVIIHLVAEEAFVDIHRHTTDKWSIHVCKVSTIILFALDGDQAAIATLTTAINTTYPNIHTPFSLTGNSEITIETQRLLLTFLEYSATLYDIGERTGTIRRAITLFDTFVIQGITTDHDTWYLTRSFFAGIVSGCKEISTQ
jgi:hypothetical protein